MKYEYNFWDNLSLTNINKQAEDRWELVSIVPILEDGETHILRYFFKRKIYENN